MKVLLTGGAGYIGTHTCACLIKKGWEPIIVDDLSRSNIKSLDAVCSLTGKMPAFYKVDCRDEALLCDVFYAEKPDAVIHFAGYKSVGESVKKPLLYYDNNVGATVGVLKAMQRSGVNKIIFSSSATVYKLSETMPLTEEHELLPYNPYGMTKFISEQLLKAQCEADNELTAISLRYFNPVGAHPSGIIGEDQGEKPANLMPYLNKVALNKLAYLSIFGNDYPTEDGTGVWDYLHIMDLAEGHIAALEYALKHSGYEAFNLGTGKGTSVLELIAAYEEANNVKIPYEFTARREGDISKYYADAKKAEDKLNWKAVKSLKDMCRDAYNWQIKNPCGYGKE